MTQDTVLFRYKDALFQIYEETFENVRGIYLDRNTSLFETLATISAEDASCPVSATCASIAAQVEHVNFYMENMETLLHHQDPGKADWDHIWQTVSTVTPEQWEASKARLEATYRRVMALLKSFEAWDGEDDIGIPMALIVHTAYHLGEIRQATCTVKGRHN
ncbi:MAG TPA: hypothetical protein VHD90_12425 [Phototrophicaceae bacterium]|nr:hypothetical protein [Phototrophicaceae bacterium]